MAARADAGGAWRLDRRGLTTVLVVLAAAALAWIVMLSRSGMAMPGMSGMAMTGPPTSGSGHAMSGMSGMSHGAGIRAAAMAATAGAEFSWADALAFIGSWALMMAAMMLPSAAPMISLYGVVSRKRGPDSATVRTMLFAAPYAVVWALSGLPVYAAAVWLSDLSARRGWVHVDAPYAVGAVLAIAGLYQFTPLKRVCVKNCRSPIGFLINKWRGGTMGAVRMGADHAFYCLGCCALLMVVLVAAGAMGIAWVLLIATVVLFEKVSPPRLHAVALSGLLLLALGIAVLADPRVATQLRG